MVGEDPESMCVRVTFPHDQVYLLFFDISESLRHPSDHCFKLSRLVTTPSQDGRQSFWGAVNSLLLARQFLWLFNDEREENHF